MIYFKDMKMHDRNIRNPEYRKLVNSTLPKVLFSEEESVEIEKTVKLGFINLFGIRGSVTVQDIVFFKKLLKYIAKRHVNTTLRRLGNEKQFQRYTTKGYVEVTSTNEDGGAGVKYVDDDYNLTIDHELPHYLVSYLINTKSTDNNMAPEYLKEKVGLKKSNDKDTLFNIFLEEVYATLLTSQSDGYLSAVSYILSEMQDARYGRTPFETALSECVGRYIYSQATVEASIANGNPVNAGIHENISEFSKMLQDRIDEVVTSPREKREKLADIYPVECFIYELSFAAYNYSSANDRSIYDVYTKWFSRLFLKIQKESPDFTAH
jgi:hypothetical protein